MKILTIVGARPQFIKAAMVSRAIVAHNRAGNVPTIVEEILHTGQHYDANMSDIFFKEMGIPEPAVNLNVGSGLHGAMTARMLEGIEREIVNRKPDRVLVYGDTDSTLAGALAAAKLHIPVAHVEAGLRSFNRRMPEEVNRVLTDHAADLLFAPTDTAVANLRNEGIHGDHVIQSGDVMYDAALYYRSRAKKPCIPDLPDSGFALCTLHRAENTDDPKRLQNIMAALAGIARELPVILPLHPRTRARLATLSPSASAISAKSVASAANCLLAPPVSYLEMVWLLEHCQVVLTDSGGLQKEAYFFQKPCVTLRDETEWVELVEAGANMLAGSEVGEIIAAYSKMIHRLISNGSLYGDGNSAHIICSALQA